MNRFVNHSESVAYLLEFVSQVFQAFGFIIQASPQPGFIIAFLVLDRIIQAMEVNDHAVGVVVERAGDVWECGWRVLIILEAHFLLLSCLYG